MSQPRADTSQTTPRVSVATIALVLFGSGFCALVYQVAWLRLLRLIFGASTAASAAVLAIFMGGLGIGGLLLGRRADRAARPLALYGRLEVGIALAAAASPLLVGLVRLVYVGMGGTASLGTVGGTAVRLLLTALVLGLPTFLMGGTLPAMARAATAGGDRGRRTLALLYGTNTLGAVAGALTTTFVALEWLGVRASILAAAGLNLLLALLALHLAGTAGTAVTASRADTASTPPPSERRSRSTRLAFVLAAAAIVGFAFLLMELVWYRMLSPILGGSSYTFGLILAVALTGIGIGGLLYALGDPGRRPTLGAFAATCGIEAVVLIAPFALGDRLALLALALRPVGDAGFLGLAATWLLITSIVVLPTAIVAGYQFPLLVAVLGQGRAALGREIGATYAWNTAGAILGSIAGGFGLLPLLGALTVWRAVAGMLVVLALAAWLIDRDGPRLRRGLVPLTCAGLALLLLGATGPTAFWRHTPIGAGRMPDRFESRNDIDRLIAEHRRSVIWEAEGVESSVGLEGQSQYIFLINGKADGSALRDAPNMVMSVLIGAALHPEPKRALVIGLGSGQSAGWLAEVPSIEQVDVVELEPAVLEVAERCASVSFDVLNHPKVEVLVGDGRELLLTSDARYDLIFSQPSNPYRAGIASLFSQEFYRAVAERLSPGGLLLQWLQGYEVDGNLVGSAYATVHAVFPQIASWQVHENDLLLVAGQQPIAYRPTVLAERLAGHPFARGLDQTWGVAGLPGLLTGFLAGPEVAERLADAHRHRLNTDDHPRMEFGFVRTLGRPGLFDVTDLRALAAAHGSDRIDGLGDDALWHEVAELRSTREIAWGGHLAPPTPELPAAETARRAARMAYRDNALTRAGLAWSAQSAPPRAPLDRLLVAEAGAELADPRTPERAADLGPHRRREAEAVMARHAYRRGDVGGAVALLVRLFEQLRADPWIYPPVLARALVMTEEIAGRDPRAGSTLFDALATPFAVRLLEEPRWRTRFAIARHLGDARRCTEALADFEPHVPWEGRFLLDRYRCYREAGHPLEATAEAAVARYLDQAPPRLERDLVPGDLGSRTVAGGGS